jgi:hypothetical protein
MFVRHKYPVTYAVIFFEITIIFGTIYVVAQQILRQSANDPQIQMTEDIANILNSGADPQRMVPAQKIDMTRSLAPFLIVYDMSGNPIASSVILNGGIPVPPRGVFDYARVRGEDRVTWQPAPEVRNAAVIVPYKDGSVLVGRSLRETERREDQAMVLAGFGWFCSVVLLLLFGWVKSRLKK